LNIADQIGAPFTVGGKKKPNEKTEKETRAHSRNQKYKDKWNPGSSTDL
jgi:hypothetical protein